ncbi:hypothetical protein [Halopiger xanaduensis]|uniref:Uncharacterized protein n=1 Tax=Halopiger xanaduensis (strain DSM 18323 / JCM 14033 / SH-6) TaxID=797210 RepID=F8DBE1_HALXS|nr:hypothetical protein [Halopiger xanaduensis]AEH35926.1 hypothetical protein Halxa_1293 [Halopiger xanaduensis SH-6]
MARGDRQADGAEDETDPDGRVVSRRELLASVGGAGAASAAAPRTTRATADASRVRVRVYPGPVPLHGWAHAGVAGMHRDWPLPFRDGFDAIETALERVREYASQHSRLEGLEVDVERGSPVRYPLSAADSPGEFVAPSLSTVLETFREQLARRDVLAELTTHVLFCWSPFNYRVGYGGTLSPNAAIGSSGDDGTDETAETADSDTARTPVDGALAVVNLGATEIWDSRAVTRNMAIHETLHTFLTPEVAAAVNDSPCDHDLGVAVQSEVDDGRRLQITPMATSYAGPDRIRVADGAARFAGRGCANHDAFSRHDGYENVDRWEYTATPTDATLEAATRYLERTLSQ